MIILHIIRNDDWNEFNLLYGREYLNRIGYIPCCTIDTIKYVLDYYQLRYPINQLSIIKIETIKIDCEIKWEEWNDSGNFYPHVYGFINRRAIVGVCKANEWNEVMGYE